MILAQLFAVYAISWDIMAGYSGQVSLGHSLFWGGGAYCAAVLSIKLHFPIFLTVPISGLVTMAMGLLMAYPCLPLRGAYFGLASLCFPLILQGILFTTPESGREGGISGIASLGSYTVSYYISLGVMLATAGLTLKLLNSNFGLILKSIRENEVAAKACGINTKKYKIAAFLLSSFIAGIAGALWAHFMKAITLRALSLDLCLVPVWSCIIGGLGTIIGPIIGANLLTFMDNYLLLVPTIRPITYTLVATMIVLFAKGGIWGWVTKNRSK
jgi:branched-chain amino acid transport system permease protein